MGRDYYGVLGVERDVGEEALRKAYKKAAMKWHPDRNRDNKEVAEKKFKELSEAYQVLSDPKKKEIYDRYGEAGIKQGLHEGGGGGASGFSSAGFQGGFRTPEDLFRDLFEGGGGFGGSGFSNSGFRQTSHDFPFFGGRHPPSRPLRKQADTEVHLNMDLEDLFRGLTKKIKISRNVVNADGTISREDKIHHVEIKPGYRAGTQIRYTGAGGEQVGCQPADVVFIVGEKPHGRFKRNQHNLEVTHKISLADALAGTDVQIKGIDNKTYQLECREVINPDTVKIISGAGMPVSKRPGERGDLVVRFAIQFPAYLNSEKKRKLRDLLTA